MSDGRSRAGDAVDARMGDLGLTQQQLADAADVDVKTVRDLIKGTRWPIARTRGRIERALGWDQGELERRRSQNGDDLVIPWDLRDALDRLTPAQREYVIRRLTESESHRPR